ncbi:MAG TPA: ribose ABC transporter permease [Acetobacteraceae bacterium]|nr:ribose ABC transporter permease [Acetobacteraceae bacterium]
MHPLLRLLSKNKSLIGLIVLVAAISVASPNFLDIGNLLNVLRQTSINAVIAMGMTFVILTAGIDLSVGAILALCGAFAASLIAAGHGLGSTIPIVLLCGIALGSLSGLVITYGAVQPFIATLVSMTILRGVVLVYSGGRPIDASSAAASDAFGSLGEGYLIGIPIPVVVAAIAFAGCWVVLTQTRFGRYVYAIGGNESVARLSGVNVALITISVYAVSGLLSAVAGIILTARLESAQPTAGTGYELDAIAAVVVGGTSLAGGIGSMSGTLLGALIIGVLNNALNLLDVSSYYQAIAKGSVILLAVLVDRRGKLG